MISSLSSQTWISFWPALWCSMRGEGQRYSIGDRKPWINKESIYSGPGQSSKSSNPNHSLQKPNLYFVVMTVSRHERGTIYPSSQHVSDNSLRAGYIFSAWYRRTAKNKSSVTPNLLDTKSPLSIHHHTHIKQEGEGRGFDCFCSLRA